MSVKTCPVCGYAAGKYRQGTCSPRCDMVLGDDAGLIVIALVFFLGLMLTVAGVLLAMS